MLSIPEELYLLTISPDGEPTIINKRELNLMLASSILMDLALNRRIDCDLKNIIPDDPTPTGDEVLDELLSEIHQAHVLYEINYWIAKVLDRVDKVKSSIVTGLVRKGVLKIENEKVSWFFSARKYPMIDDLEQKEVRVRLRETVFGYDIPDMKDAVMISLLYHCNLLESAFSEEEIEQKMVRIQQIAMMDLIGQAISRAVHKSVGDAIAQGTRSLFNIRQPREEFEDYVAEIKAKYKISNDQDLPEWMRKGSAQFDKTLEYIDKAGTGYVIFNKNKQAYQVLQYGNYMHIFGQGG